MTIMNKLLFNYNYSEVDNVKKLVALVETDLKATEHELNGKI